MAKRILIVSYHFYPDAQVGAKRMSELVRVLCDQGHEVVVVSSKAHAKQGVASGLDIDSPRLRRIRIPSPPKLLPAMLSWIKRLRPKGRATVSSGQAQEQLPDETAADESLLARLKRYYFSLEWLVDDKKLWSALVAARLLGFAFSKPFDVVISSGPPMSSHLSVWLTRPVLRCRWIMDMRDPWCDQDQNKHVESVLSRRLNRWLERCTVTVANAVVVTAPGYKRLLQQRYPTASNRIHLVLNGFDQEQASTPAPRGRLNLLYAGSLYYNRDPFPLLRSVRDLVRRSDVERGLVSVRFVGDCRSWGGVDIARWVQENQLEDCVRVEPPVPAGEVHRLLADANVLLSFAQGQPMQIPAKMFDYLAARREILLITEPGSDTAWLARQAGCGRIVSPDDDAAMHAALAGLYADYVVGPQPVDLTMTAVDRYSRQAQCGQFLELLHETVMVEQEASL